VFKYNSSSFLKSTAVFSQNILSAIYHVFQSSNIFDSTEGILILSLITSIFNTSVSHCLRISSITFVQAFHFILSTASYKSIHSSLVSLALIIISHDCNQKFLAGDHFIILSIITHNSFFSTTAHIHSKSHDKTSLNF
jgi:hypothetical protein